MKELDRVFDCDDVVVKVLIEVVGQACQRCTLARSRWSGDQKQAARTLYQLSTWPRQLKLIQGQQLVGDQPQAEANKAALFV